MSTSGTGVTVVREAVLDWENEGGGGQRSTVRAECMVCSHSAEQHDKIARRYCDATIAGALPRGCICR